MLKSPSHFIDSHRPRAYCGSGRVLVLGSNPEARVFHYFCAKMFCHCFVMRLGVSEGDGRRSRWMKTKNWLKLDDLLSDDNGDEGLIKI